MSASQLRRPPGSPGVAPLEKKLGHIPRVAVGRNTYVVLLTDVRMIFIRTVSKSTVWRGAIGDPTGIALAWALEEKPTALESAKLDVLASNRLNLVVPYASLQLVEFRRPCWDKPQLRLHLQSLDGKERVLKVIIGPHPESVRMRRIQNISDQEILRDTLTAIHRVVDSALPASVKRKVEWTL